MTAILLALQLVLGAALFYSCFCRLVKTDHKTIREVRWAIWLESVVAGMVVGAPVLPLMVPDFLGTGFFRWQPGETPLWVWIELLAASALMQIAASKYWRGGTPPDIQGGHP